MSSSPPDTPDSYYFLVENGELFLPARCSTEGQDPATGCTTCTNSAYVYPECTVPQTCDWDSDCANGVCGREYDTHDKVCCPTGQLYSFLNFDFCAGYEVGQSCSLDGQCKNDACGREYDVDKKVCCSKSENCLSWGLEDWCSGYEVGTTCKHDCQCTSDSCVNGKCACPSGQQKCADGTCAAQCACDNPEFQYPDCNTCTDTHKTSCDDFQTCTDLSSDHANCGACGKACAAGTETCMGGTCMCNEQNVGNCGPCGNACAEGDACCESKCIYGGCGCDCKGTEVCDTETNRCSDTFCTSDAQCQARGTGYCVTADDKYSTQNTCSQEFCNPYEATAGRPCPDLQVCAYPWPGSKFQPYRCSAEFCSSDEDCIKRGGAKKCAKANEKYTCESDYCESAEECDIGGCVNYTCTESCVTTNAPLAYQDGYSIPMQSNNTAYTYAPIEMFETNALYSDLYQQYINYVHGFWGFIQVSGNQIFANETKKALSNPTYAKSVARVAGNLVAGYRNWNSSVSPSVSTSYETARFNQPQGLAVCKTINPTTGKYRRPIIFVADTGNHCIRMISATITQNDPNYNPTNTTRGVSTLTGSNWDGSVNASGSLALTVKSGFQDGTLNEALFDGPTGLDFDSKGILYVADTGNNKLRKIEIKQADINISDATSPLPTITGKVSTVQGLEGLEAPRGVLFHSGTLYVSDNTTIYTIDVLNTNTVKQIATGLSKPYDLAFSGNNLLFSDDNGVKIMVGPNDIRPVPNAVFTNKPLALMEYKNNTVVGLKDATAVQISGKNCTCFPEIANNC